VRLALVASLQVLPARQRAVLILRDVLDWPAARVAEALGTSTAAVKSSLQRARGRLEQARPTVDEVSLPDERVVRDLLDRYIDAFERADPSMLELLLSDDATLEVTPSLTWSAGKVACLRVIRDAVGAPGDWRLVPTWANGQPAAVAYRRDGSGVLRSFGVAVLAVTSTHITGIVVFNEPALVARFEPVV
jgi:RNA polymerase sigma-70 factor (ECF subfamily)